MASAAIPPHDVADLSLAPEGAAQIAWASEQMPVLRRIRERFEQQRPLEGVRIAACLHVTAETANLVLALVAGGAEAALCSANPLSTQDDVAAALVYDHGVEVRAMYGEGLNTYAEHIRALLSGSPQITIDDGADLQVTAHELGGDVLGELIGGTEETTTGLVRLRRLEEQGKLACPVLAVNEARAERALNDRHGTGQSAIDGIVRASHVLLAGQTVVIVGYGWAGLGIAERARGAGAAVIVCEIDPLRALEARMAGYEVMPALEAADARRHLRDGHRLAPRAARRALRADEGRSAAGKRRALRRGDRSRRAALGWPRASRRSARWSSSTASATAGG